MSSFEKWDKECDDINSDKQKLMEEMKARIQKEESVDGLYRMSKILLICAKTAEKTHNKELETSLTKEALSYAEKGCKKDWNNSECHKWYCAAVGKLANLSATKERIKYGKEFKDHADIALRLNPNDYFMQLIYGQWCYNVASLSWIERKIAQTVYGTIPEANYDMAFNAFKKAIELDPHSKEVHLWIAKALIAKKQTKEAKEYLQKGLKLKNKTVGDEICHNEMEALNKKY